jgi:LysM repeat protein
MRGLLFLVIFLSLTGQAQQASFTDYLAGSADVSVATVSVYLQNISPCIIEEVKVRIAHDNVYFTTDETTLHVQLQPEATGTFVMKLKQVASEGWQWTIDGITVTKPEPAGDCKVEGVLEFEKISFGTPVATLAESTATTQTGGLQDGPPTYTVKLGDTVYQIADKFGVSIKALLDANNRSSFELFEGEILQIPSGAQVGSSSDTQYTLHTIVAGDTLYRLARQYNTTVELIEAANCLGPNTVLVIGNQLRIPPGGLTAVTEPCN